MKKHLLALLLAFIAINAQAQTNLALNFDGSNDFVDIPNSASLNVTSAITVEFWIQGTTTANTVVFEKGGANTNYHFQTSNITMTAGGSYLFFGISPNNTTGRVVTSTPVLDGNPHHIAATFDDAANTMRIYVDGILSNSNTGATNVITANSDPVQMGSRSGVAAFPGTLDEVRVWNSIRTQAQIQANMYCSLTLPQSGLVAYYNFNHPTAVAGGNNAGLTSLTDNSPNGNTGTLTNFALNAASSNWVTGISSVAPSITTCANINTGSTIGSGGTVVYYSNISAAGSPSPTITYSIPNGSFFPIGTTPVTATATNCAGTATCTFNVTIPYVDWIWFGNISSTVFQEGDDVATDASGNVYVFGNTDPGTVNFGCSQITPGANFAWFLTKYNSAGEVLWVRSATSSSTAYRGSSSSLDVNQSTGEIVIQADFAGTITLGAITLTSLSGSNDNFVAKYDASGNVLWAQRFGGTGYEETPSDVKFDNAGNIITIGGYGSGSITIGSTTLSNSGGGDGYMAKLNSSGSVTWVKWFDGFGNNGPNGLAIDASNNIYVCGSLAGNSAQLGLTMLGTPEDGFVAKFNSAGTLQWARTQYGNNLDRIYAIALDPTGNVYTATHFYSAGLTIGATSHANAGAVGTIDIALTKYDNAGTVIWTNKFGSANDEVPENTLVYDNAGSLYLGFHSDAASLTVGSQTFTNAGTGRDFYIAKADAATGAYISTNKYGGTASDNIYGLKIDNSGQLYVCGSFSSPTMTLGTLTLTNTGSGDVFVGKIAPFISLTCTAPATVCQGATHTINYTATGTFNAGNIFTAQLSDATGSFCTPTNIGTVAATTSGSITVTIPGAMPTGTGYRIRVIASDVLFIGNDNGSNIQVGILPVISTCPSNITQCDNYIATWTNPTATGLPAPTVTSTPTSGSTFAAGITTVTATATNACASSSCTFTVTINESATAPTSVTTDDADNNICAGNNITLTANTTNLGTPAGSVTWYEGGCGAGASIGIGASLTLTPSSGTHDYYARIENSCGNTTCQQVTVVVSSAPVTVNVPNPPITGLPVAACGGSSATISTTATPLATQYIWDGPAGCIFNATGNPYVSTTPNATLVFGSANGSGYYIGVQAANACGASTRRVQWVRGTVSVPASVTALNGQIIECANTSAQYSTPAVTGASSYLWTFMGNGTVTGTGTTATVNFGPSFTGGAVCVAAQTSCYTSPTKCLAITNAPSTVGAMSGTFSVCAGPVYTYSVPAQAGVASYNWTLPTGASGTSTSNSINVTFAPTFVNGDISVTATSICGVTTSPPRKRTANIGSPTMPASITGPSSGLCSQTVVYTSAAQPGSTFNWTAPAATINSGQGSNAVSVTFGTFTAASTVCVTASNTCGASAPRCITVNGKPNSPGSITAIPSSWCANTSGVEFGVDVTGLTGSYTLSWLYPGSSVAQYVLGGGNSTSLILNWLTGSGPIHVTASNGCGNSTRTSTWSNTCREGEDVQLAVGNEQLTVYPNPVSSILNVELYSNIDASTTIQLIDVTGKVVLQKNSMANAGINNIKLDVGSIAKGIYILSANNKQIKLIVE